MGNPRIFAHQTGPESSAFSIIEFFYRASTTLPGPGEIAAIKSSESLEKESFHQNPWILKAFSKDQGFIRQLAADAKITADNVVSEIAPHHCEQFRSLLHAIAESTCSMEDWPDFRGCISPRGDVGGAERTKQFQLASIPRGRRLECSGSSRPLERWLIASVCANRSRDLIPAFRQNPMALSVAPATARCSATISGCVSSKRPNRLRSRRQLRR